MCEGDTGQQQTVGDVCVTTQPQLTLGRTSSRAQTRVPRPEGAGEAPEKLEHKDIRHKG